MDFWEKQEKTKGRNGAWYLAIGKLLNFRKWEETHDRMDSWENQEKPNLATALDIWLSGFSKWEETHDRTDLKKDKISQLFAKKINSRVYGGIKTPPLHYEHLNRACKKKIFFATFMTSVSQNLCQISTDFYLDRLPRAPMNHNVKSAYSRRE